MPSCLCHAEHPGLSELRLFVPSLSLPPHLFQAKIAPDQLPGRDLNPNRVGDVCSKDFVSIELQE